MSVPLFCKLCKRRMVPHVHNICKRCRREAYHRDVGQETLA